VGSDNHRISFHNTKQIHKHNSRHRIIDCRNSKIAYIKWRWSAIAQSVQQLATGWTVRRSNPAKSKFFRTAHTGPGAHPASYTILGPTQPPTQSWGPPRLLHNPGAHPASYTILGPTQPPTQCLLGLSRGQSGRGVALTTTPFSAEDKERVNLYILSPLGFRYLFWGVIYLYIKRLHVSTPLDSSPG